MTGQFAAMFDEDTVLVCTDDDCVSSVTGGGGPFVLVVLFVTVKTGSGGGTVDETMTEEVTTDVGDMVFRGVSI
jgi:hypothetical protein